MKPLFLITSALNPSYGVFSLQERLEQTQGTIKSIRKHVPEADVFLVDVSVNKLPDEVKAQILPTVNYYMDLSDNETMKQLSLAQAKSQSEAYMTLCFLDALKANNLAEKYDRIFKITGRMELYEGFDISSYDNLKGKYVFQKRVATWMSTPYKECTHLYNTRLYSFCSTLLETHIQTLSGIFEYLNYVDLEHAMFARVPTELVVEFDKVYSKGPEASTGKWNYD